MIDLFNGGITDILPSNLRETPEVQALSYSIMKACQKIQLQAKRIGVYANIDYLPEKILDVLAIELRTQFYDETFPIETKRELIKNTLAWYSKAGTVAAIEEPVKVIFGSGEIEEWFDYGGLPYHFRVRLRNVDNSPESRKRFLEVLGKVKRKSIVLDAILYIYTYELLNKYNTAVRTIHHISLSPFNSYVIAKRDGKHKRDGTVTRAGYTVIPYKFPVQNLNKVFLDNVNMIIPKILYYFTLKNLVRTNVRSIYSISMSPFNSYVIAQRDGKSKRNGTVTRAGYTGIKPYRLPISISTTVQLQSENIINNAILTTKAPIRRNSRYKRDGTAYRDGLTAKYIL